MITDEENILGAIVDRLHEMDEKFKHLEKEIDKLCTKTIENINKEFIDIGKRISRIEYDLGHGSIKF